MKLIDILEIKNLCDRYGYRKELSIAVNLDDWKELKATAKNMMTSLGQLGVEIEFDDLQPIKVYGIEITLKISEIYKLMKEKMKWTQ